MASFQAKLAAGLARRGIEVYYNAREGRGAPVLVVGGTRRLGELVLARRQGRRILQRLDGMNWMHRRRRTGLKHFLRAEYGNFLLRLIRDRLAHAVVYQSQFARQWWERVCGVAPGPARVIYNGVDLQVYTPAGEHHRPADRFRLLVVEGALGGGYEAGLETAVRLGERLAPRLPLPIELVVAGKIAPNLQQAWQRQAEIPLLFLGQVPPEQIPRLDRSAHLLFSADINAACPNTVIEALACGLPVAAFDTGALPELVQGEAGCIVPYGGDPWRLDPPDVAGLAKAAGGILLEPEKYRRAARRRAEEAFGLETMIDLYLGCLF